MGIVAVLAELDLGDSTAQVALDREGDVRLLRSRTDEYGQLLVDSRPHQLGIDGDRELVAGRLPASTVSAEVVPATGRRVPCVVGSGAWLVLLRGNSRCDFSPVPVLFRDRDGAPVVVRLPADWPREPVTDTEVPCPACRRCEWDVVTAAWEGIGEVRTTRWGHGSSGPGARARLPGVRPRGAAGKRDAPRRSAAGALHRAGRGAGLAPPRVQGRRATGPSARPPRRQIFGVWRRGPLGPDDRQ